MSDKDQDQPTPPEGNQPEKKEEPTTKEAPPSTKTSQIPLPKQPDDTSRVKTKTEQVPVKTSRISLSGKPETKTSQIPLRKETVRITLKATPESRGDRPAEPKPMAPSATPPTGAPTPPTPPRPPSATTPLKPTPPTAPPTVPLKKAGGPQPAPTVPLRPSAPTASPTVPLRKAAPTPGATQVLPQATTKLKQTQPLGQPPSPNVPVTVGPKVTDVTQEEGSDGLNIALAALILLTTIFIGLLEYSKSRISEVDEIGTVQPKASWMDLLGQ